MKKNNKKFFIEALEQRIMLDGAGASTFIDTLDAAAHDKFSLNNESKVNKFVESANKDSDVKLPFINQTRDQKRNELKQVVFIDTQVEDYQQLIRSFDKNTEIYLIQSNENGFDKINQTLKGYKNIDSLHIIGHGSAGQILFGDALLSNDTFNQYSKTLKSIGSNLSQSGDILFYGCNIASNERGLSLISKISEITKADIAASDDVTGKGGDWHLETNIGIIETKNIQVADYEHSLLQSGVSSIGTYVEEKPNANDFRARSQSGSGEDSDSEHDFVLVLERENVSNAGTLVLDKDDDGNSNVSLNTSDYPVNSYLLFLNDDHNTGERTSKIGQVVFEHEIYGIFVDAADTVAKNNISKAGATYPTSSNSGFNGRTMEGFTFYANNTTSSTSSKDWISIGADKKTLRIGAKNGNKGDYIRVITASPSSNTAPVAQNDRGVIVEDGTLTVANSANANMSDDNWINTTGEHSGDVIHTSLDSRQDTDADSDTLVVSAIRVGGTEGSGTAGTLGQALTGTYGQLTLNSNGSYSYVANQDAADVLDAGDTANDVFNYTISDGNGGTDIATITIVILGANDAPVAQNDVGVIVEDGTLTVANGANANVAGSYDATGEHTGDVIHTSLAGSKDTDVDGDDTANLVVSAVRVGGTEGSGTAGTVGDALTGTYGQLTLNANGSYSYVANQDAADVLDAGDTATDVFNYTISDGTATDIATITITILGANDAPVARNDWGVIVEDGTLTVANSANANVTGNFDVTGEHSGDVIHTSLSSRQDTDVDGDDTANLVVSAVRVGGTEGSGTAGTLGQALTGTYGQLTLNANGSYSYVANQDAADVLDAGDSANDYFNYTVSDGNGGTDIAKITITILGANDAPVAQNDVGVIDEGQTLSVANGANANVSGSYDADDEHTGDVIHTSLAGSKDADVDGDDTANLVISAVRVGGTEGSGTTGTLGQALSGTYGALTLNANGSYSYAASDDISGLRSGQTVTDVFNYTVSDGTATDTATITITILGQGALPVARNDVGLIVEGGTLTVANGADPTLSGSYDATGEHSGDVLTTNSGSHADTDADSDTLVVSAVRVGSSEGNGTAGTLGQALTGTYGQLTLNANGSYSYVANQDAADALDAGDTVNDVFNYTVSDGNEGTDIATITITILGANDAPVAQNDVGVIDEGQTLSVANGANANVSGNYDADDEHTGDVIHTSLAGSKDTDIDGDDTANLVVSAIRVGNTEGSGTAGTVGQALTGSFGALTLNANGSYSYVAATTSGLFSGDTRTDYFNYTVSDGTATDTATLTITILGVGTAPSNDAPVARDDRGIIVEDGTLTVANGANANVSDDNHINTTGEHSGDVIHTNLNARKDTDANSDTLTVTSFRTGSSEGNGTAASSMGSALQGTYGQLTLNADGSYSYVANHNDADVLDAGDSANDVFNYTISDGNGGTDIATITIVILGANDAPVAQNDVGVIVEDGTLTVANSANANVSGSYDATGEHSGDVIHTSLAGSKDTDIDGDDTANLVVSAVRVGGTEGSGTAGTLGQALTGTYGQLTLNANGSYSYVANQDAADVLDAGDSATDVFNYTVSDGTATDIATITITILGANDAPAAQNDVGVIVENGTLTVANSANANVSGSYDATGEHTGDVIHTSLAGSKDADVDGDDTANLVISAVRVGGTEGSGTAGTLGQALTGTYGQLTLNADGSYSYVANQDAAEALDAGDTATDVFNYTVSDGNGTTFVDAFNVATQESSPQGVTFNNDGTKMFVIGAAGKDVNEYTLTTGFDVSTASFVDAFSVASQETSPMGLAFNNDGTKMFVSGNTGDDINEYTLTTGFDVSTASFVDAFSVSSQVRSTQDVTFNDDGTKMFVTNSYNGGVNEYTLSTGFDVSTASYVDFFDTGSQEGLPTGIAFNNDGTKMFVVGINSDNVSEYTLTTGFDVSTASFVDAFSVNAQEGSSRGIAFNNDGTKMFVTGDTGGKVNEYTLTTGFDLNNNTDTATITITILGVNDAPVAQDDRAIITEDGTLTVANGANANVSGDNWINTTGEHSGDVIHTSLAGRQDTDVDGDDTADLVVSAVRVGDTEGSGTEGTVGQALTGTYGQLTLNADGSYSYVANQDAADVLDAGDTANDVFNYTVSDGNGGTDTATITIVILGANDAPVAQNDVGVVVEDGTLTVANSANANVSGSYDATGEHSGDVIHTSLSGSKDTDVDGDDTANLVISAVRVGGTEGSGTEGTVGQALTGTYGQLTLNSNGSYSYIANQDAAEALDVGDTATDVFNYTVSDGNGGTDIATITITILGANDAPVAQNDVGVVVEDGTLTVANSANANVTGNFDATGEHSGDVLQTSSSSHKDSNLDGDDTANLVISAVRVGGTEGSGTAGTVGQALTGTYGQLTLNENGSYSYVANQDAADALDAGDTATDVFNYTVSDGNGGTDTATITITILGVNDAPVAVNDEVSFNLSTATTYKVTNNSNEDALINDTDIEGDDLTITTFRTGQEEGFGNSQNAGGSLEGTFGTITVNADGSYTYTIKNNIYTEYGLDTGDEINDFFNYTISDGKGGTDIGVIRIKMIYGNIITTTTTTTATVETGEEEQEEGKNKSKRDIRREQRQARKAEKIDTPELELPKSSERSDGEFNQGLKLVDLVGESNSVEVQGDTENLHGIKAKISEEELSLKFKVFNDEGKEVQKYYGIMKDGSELPAWVTVDSKTGKASTDIPKDINLLEFKIIAIDTDNNEKQVTVIIDPKKISQDKDIMKQVNIKNSSNITVNNNGLVELNTTNEDGLTIKTATDAVNQNKSSKDIVNSIEANEEFKIQSESRDFKNDFTFKLENILEPNFEKIKLVLKNGSEIPSWISFNEVTGKITANPPAGIEAMDIKIIIEDSDGAVTVKDLEIDFMNNDNNTLLDIEETETNFVSLNQQLIIESDNLDNYGEKLINNL